MKYIIFAFAFAALYGCGDTISQSSTGYGTNIIAESDANSSTNEDKGEVGITGVTSIRPEHCSVTPPVHPQCSQASYDACECVPPK